MSWWRAIRRWWCGLFGHDFVVRAGPTDAGFSVWFDECKHCGAEGAHYTPKWDL